jgi:DNA gyrase subunit A
LSNDNAEKRAVNSQIAAEVIKAPVESWLPAQYIVYTMYAIHSRALVSDDGLKPVNRRILWTLFDHGVTNNSPHMKAARVAGDVLAYHPHGNASVEDALARMGQSFSMRVPLIDPAGSLGHVTGDTPASARYWEARLSKQAMELLKEIPEGAAEMGKNFDGKLDEPKFLPVRWPTNIINGAEGIAVGYASKMFSHNPTEVMDAAIALVKNPELTIDQLLKIMPGPDLPTGGELLGVDGVREYYETGSGGFTIRGRYNIEHLSRGRTRIIFYELPYQVSPESVRERIRKLQSDGKFKEISRHDELSDAKNGLRLLIETKSGTNYLSVLNELFRSTPVEQKYSVNNTVLVDNVPTVVSELDLLRNFIQFRKVCTIRKAQRRIEKIDGRLYQLDAILAALIDIDKAIAIIRNAETTEDARNGLVEAFSIEPDQADYILSMQLRRLTKADSVSINKEKAELESEKAEKELILSSEENLNAAIIKDLQETKKVISDKRRTVISGLTTDEVKEASKELAQSAKAVEKNLPCYITRFADGSILKSEEPFTYSVTDKKLDNSPIIEQIKMKTQDELVIIGSDGIGHKIPLSYVTMGLVSKPKDIGVQLGDASFVGLSKVESGKLDIGVALATKKGLVKISKTDFPNRDEFPVMLIDEDDEVVSARWIGRTLQKIDFVLISSEGNALVFDGASIRVAGSKSGGVKGMKLKTADDSVVFFGIVDSSKDSENFVLSQAGETLKLTGLFEIPKKNKGGMGVALHAFKKGESGIKTAFAGTNLALSLTELHKVVGLPPVSRRASKGVDFKFDVNIGSYSVESM